MQRLKHAFFAFVIIWIGSCTSQQPIKPVAVSPERREPAATQAASTTSSPAMDIQRVLVDFESASPPVKWVAQEDRINLAPGSSGPPNVRRITDRPLQGLWALAVPIREDGRLVYEFPGPMDLRTLDVVSISVQQRGGASRLLASVILSDDQGRSVSGDYAPVGSAWQTLLLDLNGAGDVDLSHIRRISLDVQYSDKATNPTEIVTDSWMARQSQRAYTGQRLGAPRSFYAQRNGLRLHVGQVGRFEVTFVQCSGSERSWLEISQAGRQVVGQPHTGLMLFGQDQFDSLGRSIRQTPLPATLEAPVLEPFASIPEHPWPGEISSYEWNVVWHSPVAALVEVKQVAGWADELGRPTATVTWRFMIYSTGQIYVQADWGQDAGRADISSPVTIALALERSVTASISDGMQPLLHELYANASKREFFPHEFQRGNPIAMLAKVNESEKDLYWRAEAGLYRYFGVGIPAADRRGPVTCMLLVNSPTVLEQAAAFASYLSPPVMRMQMGQQDRTFPGDRDNDGLVEPYGFEVVRMTQDMAWFTLDPQNRPAYHPAILFTGGSSVSGRRFMVNLDGQQFTDLPRWPDGSYLLLIPYTVAKPIRIEARVIGGQ